MSRELARLDDGQLSALLGDSAPNRGWGDSRTIEFQGFPIFVKRIPLTDIEESNAYSTRNLYHLPTFYSYGVGSAGFGAFRELAAHFKTTKWVLEGAAERFPLTYHHRIIASEGGGWGFRDEERRRQYLSYWNDDQQIARYMDDRAAARHEVLIFLEHFPHTTSTWLVDNPNKTGDVVEQLLKTASFLRANGVVHFDAHYSNVVTDGSTHYLADYGLVMDREYDLADDERAFLDHHQDYDYGLILLSAGNQLVAQLMSLPGTERARITSVLGLADDVRPWEAGGFFLSRIDALAELMPVDRVLSDTVARYGSAMLFMASFFADLRSNPRKDTLFDASALRRLLENARVLQPSQPQD